MQKQMPMLFLGVKPAKQLLSGVLAFGDFKMKNSGPRPYLVNNSYSFFSQRKFAKIYIMHANH